MIRLAERGVIGSQRPGRFFASECSFVGMIFHKNTQIEHTLAILLPLYLYLNGEFPLLLSYRATKTVMSEIYERSNISAIIVVFFITREIRFN